MYAEHPVCVSPENVDAQIWRYMDFTKFVSLLDHKALFFGRALHLRLFDAFEGSYSKITLDHRLPAPLNPLLADFDYHIVINSWHLNENESMAMWELYLKDKPGLAIRSTFSRLKESFSQSDPAVMIGKVQYIDYLKETMPKELLKDGFNGLAAHMCKRKSFQHEAELRCIAINLGQPGHTLNFDENGGIYVPVDVDTLIEEIIISPQSPKWFYTLVKRVCNKYEMKKDIRASSMDEYPIDLRATDKSPLVITCPSCQHQQTVFLTPSKTEETIDGMTIMFFPRSVTLQCTKCQIRIMVETKVENKSANTANSSEQS